MQDLTLPTDAALQQFEPTEAALRELVANATPLLEATDATIAQLHEARRPLKEARIAIKKTREALVAPALEFQRAVNARSAQLIEIIEPTEDALEARQRAAEAEAKRRREEAEAAALQRIVDWSARFHTVGVALPAATLRAATDEQLAEELATATQAHQERLAAEAAERAAIEEAARIEREAKKREEAAARAAAEEAARVERAQREAALRAQEAELRAARERQAEERRAAEETARVAREHLEAERRELDAARAEIEAQRVAQAKLAIRSGQPQISVVGQPEEVPTEADITPMAPTETNHAEVRLIVSGYSQADAEGRWEIAQKFRDYATIGDVAALIEMVLEVAQ